MLNIANHCPLKAKEQLFFRSHGVRETLTLKEIVCVCVFVGRHEGVDGPLISQCSGATIDKGKREALLSDTQKPEPLS